MGKIYKTASGKQLDIDQLIQKNESVIAVGNRKVNARGDELGPGGKIAKTRDQVMREYYALNTPVAMEAVAPVQPLQPVSVAQETPVVIHPDSGMDEADIMPEIITPVTHTEINSQPILAETTATQFVEPVVPVGQEHIRGSLASSVAKDVTVTQTPKLPPKKANGIQRF